MCKPWQKPTILKTSLELLYYSGASQALRPIFGGLGAIFMLHHVRPGGGRKRGFAPNSGLEVTPEFLDAVISFVKLRGYDLVSMAEAVRRIRENNPEKKPFVVFTLDDAYRDNLVHARPVFRKHQCPFTIFASPAIQDGTCELWWRGLEAVIAGNTKVSAEIGSIEAAPRHRQRCAKAMRPGCSSIGPCASSNRSSSASGSGSSVKQTALISVPSAVPKR